MTSTFNENFYIVTATVNPIFFLALTLQGTFYNSIISKIHDGVNALAATTAAGAKISDKDMAKGLFGFSAFCFALAILLAAFSAELFALLALYDRSDDSYGREFVFWSTIGMLSLTATIPAVAAMRGYYELVSAIINGMTKTRKNLQAIGSSQESKEGGEGTDS